MNKSIILSTLIFGLFICVNSANANIGKIGVFEGFKVLQNSPWDPRDSQTLTNDQNNGAGEENLPAESQAEE